MTAQPETEVVITAAEYDALRAIERAVRDLLFWPFNAEHPAKPDGYVVRGLLWDVDEARKA